MKMILKTTSLLTLCFAGSICMAADAKATITGIYDKITALTIKKDVAGLQKMLKDHATPDFTFTGPDKRTIKAGEMMDMMKSQLLLIDKIGKMTTKIDKFTLKGNTATVVTTNITSMTMKLPNDPKVHVMGSTEISTDVWKLVKGVWKIQNIKVTDSKMTQDGKALAGN